MKILLIDADSHNGFPNLALMKLSNYHKSKGDQVFLNSNCDPDIVYISCVFDWNRSQVLGIKTLYPETKVHVGGSGVSLLSQLPENVEHLKPDYSLYDYDFSVGFTSRGCIRKCPFCIVPEKEGYIRNNALITEFLDESHDKVVLLDNNFLASPRWKQNLKFIIKNDLKVNFNQGLDIRLITEENANLLSQVRSMDFDFKDYRYYFAWDLLNYEEQFFKGLAILEKYGISQRKIMVYVLIGFNTTEEEDIYRIEKLKQRGVLPYVMTYNNRKDQQYFTDFERWVNRRYYKFVDWNDYDSKIRHPIQVVSY